ncbi:group I intron-associated PD-(D/E)XK endonuclease [Streptomyces sp. NPDC015684]|uniref:group I intron-associated PD-(D/E)XK endonuclease n=1 Tax=Streptomyces sp. NPDC015684 TaxID=3364963 RepID=UPI0036FB96E5
MKTQLSPKARGELTEAIVIAKLVECGYQVSLPFGDNQRYDVVADDGERLHRIQIKTARDGRTAGTVQFNTVSIHPISGRTAGYHGQIEAFVAYHPGSHAFFWVPVDECQGHRFAVRLSPAKNNQVRGTRPAERYRLQPLPSSDRS